MVPLRGGLYPVFVLRVVLLPLNCLRLYPMQRAEIWRRP